MAELKYCKHCTNKLLTRHEIEMGCHDFCIATERNNKNSGELLSNKKW